MTKKVNILLTKKFIADDLAYLKSRLPSTCKLINPESIEDAGLDGIIQDVEIIIGEPPSKLLLDKADRLQLIQVPWAGVDRLNFTTLSNYRFSVCNSHSNSLAVAEMAIGLLFSIVKKIPHHDSLLRKGFWNKPTNLDESFLPELISYKKIAIVGFGQIGKRIVSFLEPYENEISIIKRTVGNNKGKYPEYSSKELIKYVSAFDIVIVCVPLTYETKNMFNFKIFRKMKRSAYLINISRGQVVNEKDLYESLCDNKIAGAAIDVWYQYPTVDQPSVFPSKYPFHKLKNLVMSPHRSGYVKSMLPHLNDVIENINNYCNNRPLINRVNLSKGY